MEKSQTVRKSCYTSSVRRYITTAIDFPNGDPHMGHLMEKALADVCARWFRLQGHETWFQVGTDDHGTKMQRTAQKLSIHPRDLVKQNAPKFRSLFDRLHISYDFFVSTSITPGHYETVQALWKRLIEKGHLEKKTYRGLYCSGCESFVTKKDLVDGKCPNHQAAPDEVSEENWFFRLHGKEEFLNKLLDPKKGSYRIIPDYRGNEVLSFLAQGLEDVSFSRPRSTLSWGVPVPNDLEQVMYVWCDNLTNYISSLDYFGLAEGHERPSKMGVEWWDEATVTHVIGKDIARFHALNWPAMLSAAGVKTPDELLIHGFVTTKGRKMSKSIGNVITPDSVLQRMGGNPDPIRFYLSHEIPVGRDGDFSWERYEQVYDSKLRNEVGNLLNRVVTLLKKEGGTIGDVGKGEFISASYKQYKEAMDGYKLSEALQNAMTIASDSNKYIDKRKPWELKGEEKGNLLSSLAEALRHLSLALLPFIPQTAQEISRQLGVSYADRMLGKDFVITESMKDWGSQKDWKSVGEPRILFAPLS